MQQIPRPLLSGTTVCYPDSFSPLLSLERALAGIAQVPLPYVELTAIPGYCGHLSPAEMGPEEIQALQALLAEYNLAPIALNAAADLTTDPGVETLSHAMRVAEAMDVRLVVTSVQQTDSDEGLQAFLARAPRIVSDAERHNVTVALETHRGYVRTGMRGVQLLRRIGSERIKLAYDTANVLNRGGVRPEEDLAQMGSDIGRYVAHVHLKDKATMTIGERIFPPFGTGVLDFQTMLTLLYEGGYRGPMSLEVELDGEPESPEAVDNGLRLSLEYLEQFWSD